MAADAVSAASEGKVESEAGAPPEIDANVAPGVAFDFSYTLRCRKSGSLKRRKAMPGCAPSWGFPAAASPLSISRNSAMVRSTRCSPSA